MGNEEKTSNCGSGGKISYDEPIYQIKNQLKKTQKNVNFRFAGNLKPIKHDGKTDGKMTLVTF